MEPNKLLPVLADIERTHGKLLVNSMKIKWVNWKMQRYMKVRDTFNI